MADKMRDTTPRYADLLPSDAPLAALVKTSLQATNEAQLALFEHQAKGLYSEDYLDRIFGLLDTDKDGRVSRGEFLSRAGEVIFTMQRETLSILGEVQRLDVD